MLPSLYEHTKANEQTALLPILMLLFYFILFIFDRHILMQLRGLKSILHSYLFNIFLSFSFLIDKIISLGGTKGGSAPVHLHLFILFCF